MKNIVLSVFTVFLSLISNAQTWSLTGNSGTNPPSDFLGTTDKKALVFKTNKKERIRIDNSGNVGIGITSPAYTLDIKGDINLSLGNFLRINGIRILRDNPLSGDNNVFLGDYADTTSSPGFRNTAVGSFSMSKNTGAYNTAFGSTSLLNNTSGSSNTALGEKAMYSNWGGNYNIAVGSGALYGNLSEGDNVAVGFQSLYYSNANENTAIGNKALYANTFGYSNTASGYFSLAGNTEGYLNTASGTFSLLSNTTGSYNSSVGNNADVNSGNYSNTTIIGSYTYGTASNQVRIGNNTVTSIGGYTNWTNISDGRVKKNIKENVPGLDFINLLKPVTYNYDLESADKIIWPDGKPQVNKDPENISAEAAASHTAKEQLRYTGFIAQDVEAAATKLGYDFSGVDIPKNDKDLYGLRYAEFVVPLVKAVQELSRLNNQKDSAIAELHEEINQIKRSGTSDMMKPDIGENPLLGQNIPNPFDHSTLIPFRIPGDCHDASIAITETGSGRIVKLIPVSCTETQLSLDADSLASGNYSYSLYVDGKLVETKQMELSK